jgi:hypothetical protein
MQDEAWLVQPQSQPQHRTAAGEAPGQAMGELVAEPCQPVGSGSTAKGVAWGGLLHSRAARVHIPSSIFMATCVAGLLHRYHSQYRSQAHLVLGSPGAAPASLSGPHLSWVSPVSTISVNDLDSLLVFWKNFQPWLPAPC